MEHLTISSKTFNLAIFLSCLIGGAGLVDQFYYDFSTFERCLLFILGGWLSLLLIKELKKQEMVEPKKK